MELSPSGLADVEGLLNAAFPHATYIDARFLEWSYAAVPAAPAVGCNAVSDGSVVAHYAAQPIIARIFGELERGAVAVNGGTHPDHRGHNLFARVIGGTHEAAAAAGCRFIVSVGNASSTRLLVDKAGYQHIGSLDARVGLGPPPDPDERPTELQWERVWDDAELDWRLACPARPYSVSRRNGLATVHASTGRFGIQVELARLARCAATDALPTRRSLQPLRLWIGLDPDRHWGRSIYASLSMRLRPSPLNLCFLDLSGRGRRLEPSRVAFQGLDFDAY